MKSLPDDHVWQAFIVYRKFRKFAVDGRYIVIYAVYSDSIKIYRILDARKKFDTLID